MKKEKSKMWKGFFINVLGVIVGIILTFGGNALWQRREENKKIKEMLILVRTELIDCKEWLKDMEEAMKNDGYTYSKIWSARRNITSIPADSLKAYHLRILNLSNTQLSTSAWQIFQNSESIQKMTDKDLVIMLTDCYVSINIIYESVVKEYWAKKRDLLFAFDHEDSFHFFSEVLNNNEYSFFFSMYRLEQDGIWKSFITVDALIDYTVILLDQHGDYRYNKNEKDKEVESFIEARIDSLLHKKNTIK